MHIAAADPQPQYVNTSDVPEAVIAAEKDIYVAQAAESGKPPEIIEKMVGDTPAPMGALNDLGHLRPSRLA